MQICFQRMGLLSMQSFEAMKLVFLAPLLRLWYSSAVMVLFRRHGLAAFCRRCNATSYNLFDEIIHLEESINIVQHPEVKIFV